MSEDDPLPKKLIPSWMKGLLASVIGLTILVGYFLSGRESPSVKVESHIKAMQGQNISSAYFDFLDPAFQDKMQLDTFKVFVRDLKENHSLQNIELEEQISKTDKNNAEVIVKDKKTHNPLLVYFLHFEKNKWKIENLKDVRLPQEVQQREIGKKTEEPSETSSEVKESVNEEDIKPLDVASITPALSQIVHKVFDLIKQGKITEVYKQYTSEIFQSVTSLAQFEHFAHSYPFLREYKSLEEGKIETKDGSVSFEVIVEYARKNFPIEFLFKEEKGDWKIQSFKITLPHDYDAGEINQKDQILFPVANQLKALKKGNKDDAYEAYTSKEFKEFTSAENFQKFLDEAYFLSSYDTIDFKQRLEEAGKGYILIDLLYKEPDGSIKVKEVEYELLFEDGSWKIRGMRVVQAGEKLLKQKVLEETAKPLSFSDILIASKVNSQGIIEAGQDPLSVSDENIYVNVYIQDGKPGDQIELLFSHVDSGSKIDPVMTTIQERGDAIASFVYSAPTLGWPKGDYQVEAKGPSDVTLMKNFSVE